MITVLESHPSSHHFPSRLTTPCPLTTPTHSSSHHSPLPLLITPLTPLHTTPPSLLIINPSHYIPSLLPSLPLTTPHHPFSPPLFTYPPHTLFTTPLLTYLPHHTSSPPSSPLPSSHSSPPLTTPPSPTPSPLTPPHHHSLKGHNNTKELVKSHLSMSINLCRTFLSLKTSFLIIFCKKNFWDKIDQKLEYDGGGGAHVLNCARATSSIHFSTCNILPLKKTVISHFQVLFV